MPGIYLGSRYLDFSRNFVSYSSAVSSCESNIQETYSADTMEKIHTTNYVPHGANNASYMKGKNFIQSVWNRYIGGNWLSRPSIFLSKMGNPLSVTLVNDDLIRPAPKFMEKSSMQEETSINIRHNINNIYETIQPVTTVDPFIKFDRLNILSFDRYSDDINKMHQDEDIIIENLTHNIMGSVTCKNKSTMESHFVSNVREIEKSNNISNNSCPTEIGSQKCTDINKDTSDTDKKFASNDVDINIDAKSFLIVSHSDVPELVKPVKKIPVSRLSAMCQNAWNSLITRFYDFTMNSINSEISVKRPSYLSKRYCRRRANAIAMGRGRGRARCQLRRSGVSQTRHRKERTKRDLMIILDYELYKNDEMQYYEIQNDPTLNDKSANLDNIDGYDVLDGAMCIKRTSPVILSSSDVMPTKRKPQTPKNQEIVKHPTRMRYIIDPSTKSNKDCISETSDEEKSSCQLQVSSIDSEDNFMIFKTNHDESPKQQAEDYMNRMYHTLNSSMKSNEDCNSEIYDTHKNSFRLQLFSESSADSEDSFIIFENESPKNQEKMKYPRVRYVVDPLIKINSTYHKDCNSETSNMQESTLRSRLLSESSSADSEDSFITFETSNDELKQEAEGSIGIHGIYNFSMKINDYCKDYNSKRYMQEDALQFSETSEDTEDSFCILFNTELEDNCITDVNYIKTSTSTALNSSIDDELTIENDEGKESTNEIPIKKVSFAPAPVVHVMRTWNYAYRAARKGQWEEMARDNERFKGRINSIAAVLNPILTSKHRSKVWQERFAFHNLSF